MTYTLHPQVEGDLDEAAEYLSKHCVSWVGRAVRMKWSSRLRRT